jgi:ribose 1,5-bisphosphokinase PhnN
MEKVDIHLPTGEGLREHLHWQAEIVHYSIPDEVALCCVAAGGDVLSSSGQLAHL